MAIDSVVAPLGNSFPVIEGEKRRRILVAGGIGIGPILFLQSELARRRDGHQLLFGCRSGEYLPDLLTQDQSTVICSDDGSTGFAGTVTEYLEVTFGSELSKAILYCCGPYPMLRTCHRLARKNGTACYVSVEQVMACGVGACMGCAVKVHGEAKYARACKEGPVFDSRDIQWEM